MTVFANGRSIVHKGDGLTQTSPAPDACKTPSPGGPIPVPYVNVAMDSDLADGSASTCIEGNPIALAGSNLSVSTGDEGGTAGGGILSSKIKGKLTWAQSSADVKVEGQGVVRFLDVCLHNGNANNTGGQPNQGSSGLTYGGDAPCQICGRAGGHPIPSTETTETKANEVAAKAPETKENGSGYMMGTMTAQGPDGRTVTLRACSGTVPGFPSHPPGIPARAELRTMGGRILNPANFRTQDGPPPGACAAPKLIAAAQQMGFKPLAMTEQWQGPRSAATPEFRPGKHAESCSTCKKLLPAMLCDKE